MKAPFFFLFFILFCSLRGYAQISNSNHNSVKLFIDNLPGTNKNLNESQKSLLKNRITNLANKTGTVSVGASNFLLLPQIEIIRSLKVNPGLKVFDVVDAELFLGIYRTDWRNLPGESFSSISISLQGSGSTENEALTNAINNITSNEKKIVDWIIHTRSSIFEYYNLNCTQIIKEAIRFNQLQLYNESIALLFSIPQETPCYDTARKLSVNIYRDFLRDSCESQLQGVRSLIAMASNSGNNRESNSKLYMEALAILKQLTPSQYCYSHAQNLLNGLQNRFDERTRQEWELINISAKNEAEVEKVMYKALAEMNSNFKMPQVINNLIKD
ncbi:MAG: hypothetical protein IPL74_04300 [Bacteroidetes bacterium]|nr:hypothetical protein [Bacteroidota bacterium]